MFDFNPNARQRPLLLAVSLAALASAVPAFAQDPSGGKAESKRPRLSDAQPASPNATTRAPSIIRVIAHSASGAGPSTLMGTGTNDFSAHARNSDSADLDSLFTRRG